MTTSPGDDFEPDCNPDDADDGSFHVKEERMFAGQKRLVERQAPKVCDTDIAATFLFSPNCEQRPDGKLSFVGANAIDKSMRVLKPVNMKWVDRGTRSVAGCQRDDCRRCFARAKTLGFASVVDRWEKDSENDYEFRRTMMGQGWTKESVE